VLDKVFNDRIGELRLFEIQVSRLVVLLRHSSNVFPNCP
jgi:hypothetical protein